MPQDRLVPVHAMRIYGDEPGARLEFDAYGAGVPALAWIVEDAVLQDALWQGGLARREVFAPASLRSSGRFRRRACCCGSTMAGKWPGSSLSAPMARSRSCARRRASRRPKATTARARWWRTSAAESRTATSPTNGSSAAPVLALLPLPGAHVSMVWSLPASEAATGVRGWKAKRCAAKLSTLRSGELGELALVTPPRSYPLRRLWRRSAWSRRASRSPATPGTSSIRSPGRD